MKKRMSLIVLVLVFALALTACSCKHENVNEGNCVTDKTCADCGEVLSAAPGHTWTDADCENPKTCSACGLTEGEALGHVWQDATTEAPKTCENCGATEGERIITDERFTTAATADIQGKWAYSFTMSGEMMGVEGFDKGIDCILYMELCNDGTAVLTFAVEDTEKLEKDMIEYLMDMVYAELAAAGLSKEDADAAILEAYGMTLEEYASYAVKQEDLAGKLSDIREEMVYYVEDGKLYMGDSWSSNMSVPTPYELNGDTLILEEDLSSIGINDERLQFTRVIEE